MKGENCQLMIGNTPWSIFIQSKDVFRVKEFE